MRCTNNLKQLTLALHSYHDIHSKLPSQNTTYSAATCRPTNTSNNFKWGWGSVILPFIEQSTIYNQLQPDGCSMPPATTLYGGGRLLQQSISTFLCPSSNSPKLNPYFTSPAASTPDNAYATSNYVAAEQVMYGNGVVGQELYARFAEFSDGLSNQLAISERALLPRLGPAKGSYAGVIYGRTPTSDLAQGFHASWPPNTFTTTLTANGTTGTNPAQPCDRGTVTSLHPGGANFSMLDGSVRFISETIARNPACIPAPGCVNGGDNPPGSGTGWLTAGNVPCPGPGFVYQNLYTRSDGNAVSGEF